jgi:hypothetical protein
MRRWLSTLAAVAAIAATVAGPAAASTVRGYSPTAAAAAHPAAPAATPSPVPAAAAPPVSATSPAPASPSSNGNNGDVLAANGLRSPFCGLFTTGRAAQNCAASGVPYSPAPDSHLSYDVHIDSGVLDAGSAITAMIENLLNFIWGVCVAITHGLFFCLEWAFSLNLISSPAFPTAQLTSEIRQVTLPLLGLATAAFGLWMAWVGLIHRRHGEVLKSALHSLLLFILVLVVLYQPVATVGNLVSFSQQAGMAIIGVAAGQPGNAQASFESGLEAMYTGLVEKPAALLEFGDVDWGTDPARLSGSLRSTALALAHNNNNQKEVLAVKRAHNNLELFTAFPPNGPERNSINQTSPMSLLRALCTTDDATNCKGPTASQAEFRTAGSLGERIVSIVLIAPVLLFTWLLLGWIAFMLLASSVMALFYLFGLGYMALVSFAGNSGRQRVQSYAGNFFGAVVAAVVFAALLAMVMDVWRVLLALNNLGFVLQWLLLAIMLLVVFVKRNALWGIVKTNPADLGHRTAKRFARRAVALYAADRWRASRRTKARTGAGANRSGNGNRNGPRPRQPPRPGGGGNGKGGDGGPQPGGPAPGGPAPLPLPAPRRRQRAGGSQRAGGPEPATGIPAAAERLRTAQERSLLIGSFHAAQSSASAASAPGGELRDRADRLPRREEELAAATTALAGASTAVERVRLRRREQSLQRRVQDSRQATETIARRNRGAEAAKAARFTADGRPRDFRGEDFDRARSWLDRQATLERGAKPAGSTREARNYSRLAGIVGSTPAAYHRAPPPDQLRMRAHIDRELDRRVGLASRATRPSPSAPGQRHAPAQPAAPVAGRAPQAPRRPARPGDVFAGQVRRSAARLPRNPPRRPPRS